MTEHTPGPWYIPHFADNDHPCQCQSVVSEVYAGSIARIGIDNEKLISDGGNDCPPLEEAKANARLIAAAPDLLEKLKSSRLMLWAWRGTIRQKHLEHPELDAVILTVEAAITKATNNA